VLARPEHAAISFNDPVDFIGSPRHITAEIVLVGGDGLAKPCSPDLYLCAIWPILPDESGRVVIRKRGESLRHSLAESGEPPPPHGTAVLRLGACTLGVSCSPQLARP
jgi:hypothetical protein